MNKFKSYLLYIFILFNSLVLSTNLYSAESNNSEPSKVVKQAEQFPEDEHNRRNPRGTTEGLVNALSLDNPKKVALYLDLSYFKPALLDKKTEEVVKNLKKLLGLGGEIYPIGLISDNYKGNRNDKLDLNQEIIGTITIDDNVVQIILEDVKDKDGHPLWLVSSQTLKSLPNVLQDEGTTVDLLFPKIFTENKIYDVSIAQWIIIITLVASSILLSIIIFYTIRYLLDHYTNLPYRTARLIYNLTLPFIAWVTIWIFTFSSNQISIPILIRQYLGYITTTLYWIAIFVLIWQIVNIASIFFKNKMSLNKNYAAVSGIEFSKKIFKFSLIAIVIAIMFSIQGYDITTWIAALGIGGLAIALGAQKTIENIVGSASLIIDQPIRIGDFIQVGSTTGTIEQIGIRSTRIRTRHRTVITIPNAEFSTHIIENFNQRDNFLYLHEIGIRYETSPDQMRYILVKIRELLYAHPKTINTGNRVRFKSFADYSLKIEIYTLINTIIHDEYLEVSEDINLRIMDIIKDSGSDFAFPSQTLYLSKDSSLNKENAKRTEDIVKQWKDNNELQVPGFSDEKIRSLSNTLKYPPEGSVLAKKD